MSTTISAQFPTFPVLPSTDDPFRLGWRFVKVQDQDGKEVERQVPLTLEDVLHPQEGDFIVNTEYHNSLAWYLKEAIKAHLAPRTGTVVLSDTRVDWESSHGW